jgi:hypothetical protein
MDTKELLSLGGVILVVFGVFSIVMAVIYPTANMDNPFQQIFTTFNLGTYTGYIIGAIALVLGIVTVIYSRRK